MTTLNNTVQLIGRAGLDPEIKSFDKERKMARFSIATNSYYYNKNGERVDDTQWHQVVAWGKTAEVVEKLVKKGREVAVSGKLNNRSWEDKDGNKRYIVEIVLNEIHAFGKAAG
ncbi:MAG TPA: single-stranded DNA-binding protein [Bacteroidales bacterium]|jgi:single-strand DNA-binding protein|nr:single-stranded DNA-binding protein [Bacteroidales bacterium]MDD4086494.1 single-stranded DNA-binding protein [Bacteroidales bacterium]MDY0086677.1 single-stranded DNA-binding protein [Bacteroidales bacterium]HPE42983.1 single-stranded DNA-binding protein [Bacteroidales bacterium]